jgi:hypothetical protein
VSSASYLVSITRRQQVAQVHGKPIYVITEVALTPLHSKNDAEAAVVHTQNGLKKRIVEGHAMDESDTSDDDGDESTGALDDLDDDQVPPDVMGQHLSVPSPADRHKRRTSVAEDVISKKGGYGRFAQKWFSKKGWTVAQGRNLGLSTTEDGVKNASGDEEGRSTPPSEGQSTPDVATTEPETPEDVAQAALDNVAANLLPKLLRTTQLLFGSSKSFFFSYDYDITRSVAINKSNTSDLPLYKEVDPLFFWNHNLIQPFIQAGQHGLVLPLIQGFVGQRSFTVNDSPAGPVAEANNADTSAMEMDDLSESEAPVSGPDDGSGPSKTNEEDNHRSFSVTLISRRSVKRGGLRYLRRGVDEDGHTANTVETEQILSESNWNPSSKVYSFVQLRGSIPVFFSQSPYSFKPVPQMQHSAETNFNAFQKVSFYPDEAFF